MACADVVGDYGERLLLLHVGKRFGQGWNLAGEVEDVEDVGQAVGDK